MSKIDHSQAHTGAQYETTYKGNQELLAQAENAISGEKSMSLRETIKVYRKAVLWSIVLSTALVMEGYDVAIINSFFGQSSFLHRFGKIAPDGTLYVPANWQSALNNGASVGEVIGLAINGYCQPRFGSKRTYLCAMVAMTAAIFLLVFATSLEMLFAGEIVCGIPWGIFQTLSVAYASEICPIRLRGYVTSYVNMCWGFGLTIGAAVVRASLTIEGDWGWRMPYVVQWVWPIPLFVAVLFAPESPWWLARHDRDEEAGRSLQKLANRDYMDPQRTAAHLALIRHTIELERAETHHSNWRDMFRGTNARRTEITCIVWAAQYVCGQPITGFATQFLQNAGMDADGAFDLNIANNIMIFAGTIISWIVLYRFGRRFLYLLGTALMGVLFLVMGIIGCIPTTSQTSIGIGAIMVMITLAFGITVAPVCYSIVGEIPSTTVRSQTVVLARMCYVIAGIVLNQLFPRFITPKPDGWNIGGKAGFVFVGTNLILFIYFFFRLPETMGRTFGEIDTLFQNQIPARKFKTTSVDEFEADRIQVVPLDKKAAGRTEHIEKV